jgi:hypothetical protein
MIGVSASAKEDTATEANPIKPLAIAPSRKTVRRGYQRTLRA